MTLDIFPLSKVLNPIHFKHWRGDLFGGLTAAVVSLPMALAFGVASGAGPSAGLYGAVLVGLFASLFGGTSTLISEPTGPMTVVMTAVLSTMMAANPEQGLAMAFTVVMIAGAFQIILGLLKLGKYITLMPYSVISGFMSGIGIILILLQIAPLLGQAPPAGGVIGTLSQLPELWGGIQPQETLLGLFTLLILFFLPKSVARWVPPQLVALVLGTVAALLFFSDADIRKVGQIPLGLPTIHWPVFSQEQITEMIVNGMVLGTLGCIDALLTSMIADSLTRQEHHSDRELIGQGMGNVISGFFGGLPGAGATMGTVVNIQSGGRTILSGIIRALALIVVILWAANLTAYIPMTVLAAIALKVGTSILDWSFVKRAHLVSKAAALIMYSVMLLTVFVDLIVAVGIGVFIANILTIERLSAIQTKNIKAISDTDYDVSLDEEEKALLDQANGQVLLVQFSGPMVFGVSKAIAREHSTIQQYDCILLDLSDVPLIDTTISLAIENTIKDAVDSQKQVIIVKPRAKAAKTLKRLGVFELIPGAQMCNTRREALTKALAVIPT